MPYKDKLQRNCGFLNTEEKEGSGKFLRRYFLLDVKESRLFYYKDNPDNLYANYKQPCGEIEIYFISKVSDARKIRPKVDNCFSITYAGRTMFLEAEDEQDLLGWIKALNDASKIVVPEKHNQLEADVKNNSETGYKAEIAGGVVCKIPIKVSDEEGRSSEDSADEMSGVSANEMHSYVSGYGVKQGGMRKNWKRRFFVFSENGFQYFSSDRSKDPLRTLPKTEIIDVKKSLGRHSRDNLFEVVTAKRTFFIQCDDPTETDRWVDIMKQNLPTTQISVTQSLRRPTNSQELAVARVFPSKEWV